MFYCWFTDMVIDLPFHKRNLSTRKIMKYYSDLDFDIFFAKYLYPSIILWDLEKNGSYERRCYAN